MSTDTVDLYPLALAWEGAALAALANRGQSEVDVTVVTVNTLPVRCVFFGMHRVRRFLPWDDIYSPARLVIFPFAVFDTTNWYLTYQEKLRTPVALTVRLCSSRCSRGPSLILTQPTTDGRDGS